MPAIGRLAAGVVTTDSLVLHRGRCALADLVTLELGEHREHAEAVGAHVQRTAACRWIVGQCLDDWDRTERLQEIKFRSGQTSRRSDPDASGAGRSADVYKRAKSVLPAEEAADLAVYAAAGLLREERGKG